MIYFDFLIGAIFGWVLNELFNYIKKRVINSYKQLSLRKSLEEVFIDNQNFMAIDRAIPFYDKQQNIRLRDNGEQMFISYPEEYKDEFLSFDFEFRKTISIDGTDTVIPLLEQMNIQNPEMVLREALDLAAKMFITDLRNGENRFNGLIYGVKKLRTKRLGMEEKSGFDMEFYTTDYYTYMVFSNIYKSILNSGNPIEIGKSSDINKYYPFFSAFGLGTFIIINRGYGDEILIGKRSNSVIVEKGKWHFSMNEAFNKRDKDEYGHPSLNACLFRGLEEELGIGETYKKNVVRYEYLDLIMIADRFELGITSFARIVLSDKFTFKELMDSYAIAQDGKLETTSITTLPIKKIEEFLSVNDHEVSDACRGALKALNSRYKAGYLAEED